MNYWYFENLEFCCKKISLLLNRLYYNSSYANNGYSVPLAHPGNLMNLRFYG